VSASGGVRNGDRLGAEEFDDDQPPELTNGATMRVFDLSVGGVVRVDDRGECTGSQQSAALFAREAEIALMETSHLARAVAWHFGQWRLRHELYTLTRCPH
jgi:hypothetical protein